MKIISKISSGVDGAKHIGSKIIHSHPALTFVAKVQQRFNSDEGGNKVAYITYYAFLSMLPLLLVILTIFDIVFAHNEKLRHSLIDSTISTIPVIGPTLQSNITFVKGQGITLIVTLLILVWATRGGALALQHGLTSILARDKDQRSFVSQHLRAYASLAVIMVGLMVPTIASSFVRQMLLLRIVVTLLSIAWNTGVIYVLFAILVDRVCARGWGPLIGGVAMMLIQFLSVTIMGHTLQNARPLYGTLAIVLTLLAWIALQVRVLLYAAEINAVQYELKNA